MISADVTLQQSLEIFIDELVSDEELRDAFLRNPRKTLGRADEWGLPLSESEMVGLQATDSSIWEKVAEELDARIQ